MADFFVKTLEEDRDYEVEEKKVWLTDQGVRYAEQYFGIDNFYGREYFEINRHVTLALRAHMLLQKRKNTSWRRMKRYGYLTAVRDE